MTAALTEIDPEAPHMRENLIRATTLRAEIRSDGGAGLGTLVGHFAVYNEWTTINSRYEGTFVERMAPDFFSLANTKVLFDHGQDPSIGNKPLGPFTVESTKRGAQYVVPLIDTSYNRDISQMAAAGLLGSSFRFSVPDGGDQWNMRPRASEYNPNALPERTVHAATVPEFGPVVFPAYPGADAGLRSRTDDFVDRLLHDPIYVARFTDRTGLSVVERILASLPVDDRSGEPVPVPVDDRSATPTPTPLRRSARVALAFADLS